jgi:RNA polymerase sigma-70 factor, ECF subfamily
MTSTQLPSTPDPTEDLIQAAKAGDREAWGQLDGKVRAQLGLFLRSRIPDTTRARFDTDDVLQSAFLSAFEELDSYSFAGPGSFDAWLRKILLNRLHDRVGSEQAAKRGIHREAQGQASQLPASSGTPSELADNAERKAKLVEALAALPEDLRQVSTLHFFDGLTFTQIAERTQRTPPAVSRMVAKATRELALRLDGRA